MKASERSVVIPVTLGSMFEWFEVFLYIYWAPIMSESFFDLSIPLVELIYAIVILGTGLLARPLGGVLFGYIGDRWGRKISFTISIIAITIPSFAIALMPTFSTWAYFSIGYIGLMRFLQGIPAGGELPGALCLLSEGATPDRRKYLCSYLFVGPQIGQIFSMLLCFLLTIYLTKEQLLDWGWRLSFLIAGCVGIIGFFLRRKLHESNAFERLKTEHKIEHHPLKQSLKNHKRKIAIAFFISIFEVIGFFSIYFYLFENSTEILKIEKNESLYIYAIYLSCLTISMPIFGWFFSRFRYIPLFKISAIGVIVLSPIFYFVLINGGEYLSFLVLTFIIGLLCIQFSLLPSFLSILFPTAVRFTCIGFSFNITDGVIGGAIPFLGDLLTDITGNKLAFIFLLPLSAFIFLLSLVFLKEKEKEN